MAYFKEIVTKAIIGKAKKNTFLEHNVVTEDNINTVLGCWVINHTYNGINNGGKILVNGTYDINIWYSYDNNTKTNVLVKRFNYQDIMNIKLKENSDIERSEIIVRSLSQPSVTDVVVENSTIKLSVEKVLGVEIVGDTTVRVSVEDEYEEYEELLDEEEINEVTKDIDNIEEEYIK